MSDPTREAESEGWAELTDRELLGQVIGVLEQAEHELPHQSLLWAEVATMAGHVRRRLLATSAAPALDEPEWPALANDIRAVDGNHDLGAGALAGALIERGWTRRSTP